MYSAAEWAPGGCTLVQLVVPQQGFQTESTCSATRTWATQLPFSQKGTDKLSRYIMVLSNNRVLRMAPCSQYERSECNQNTNWFCEPDVRPTLARCRCAHKVSMPNKAWMWMGNPVNLKNGNGKCMSNLPQILRVISTELPGKTSRLQAECESQSFSWWSHNKRQSHWRWIEIQCCICQIRQLSTQKRSGDGLQLIHTLRWIMNHMIWTAGISHDALEPPISCFPSLASDLCWSLHRTGWHVMTHVLKSCAWLHLAGGYASA